MEQFQRSICWLRRDLRLNDHAALAEATSRSKEVVVCFVYDTNILYDLSSNDRRLTFIHGSLQEIASDLEAKEKILITLNGDPVDSIPRLASMCRAEAVFCSHDDDPYALNRDKTVGDSLSVSGIEFLSFKDHVIFERNEVVKDDGTPYRVFTPYSKAWKNLLKSEHYSERIPELAKIIDRNSASKLIAGFDEAVGGNIPLGHLGFEKQKLYTEPGSKSAQESLTQFIEQIDTYKEQRDFPAINGTSRLSVHLRHGTISIRECLRAANRPESAGSCKWVDELIWREFYQMILAQFPHVVHSAFQPEYDSVQWQKDDVLFEAWKQGETGYPIVDAAMRCFAQTGWMHNRLRMIVASFLTKDLLQHWNRGEEYFAANLLDYELASNNGGWQWAASTGVDAQPYFRIFNPVLQSKKFDPEGAFIREWVPELASLGNKEVHWPHDAGAGKLFGYTDPIVNHFEQRPKAIAMLEEARRPT